MQTSVTAQLSQCQSELLGGDADGNLRLTREEFGTVVESITNGALSADFGSYSTALSSVYTTREVTGFVSISQTNEDLCDKLYDEIYNELGISTSFLQCRIAITRNDPDSDDLVDRPEYPAFVNQFSRGSISGTIFTDLPEPIQLVFNDFQVNDAVNSTGARPGVTVDEDQVDFLEKFCQHVSIAIISSEQVQQTPPPTEPPTSPPNTPIFTSLQCRLSFALTDGGRDEFIDSDDYYAFVLKVTPGTYAGGSFDTLPLLIRENFNDLSTTVDGQTGISIPGVQPGPITPEEQANLESICAQTDVAIRAASATAPPSASPLPPTTPPVTAPPTRSPPEPIKSCNLNLILADDPRDGFLGPEEYYVFLNRVSSNEWANSSFETIPSILRSNFNKYAVDGRFDITGTRPSTSSDEDIARIGLFCDDTALAIQTAILGTMAPTESPGTSPPTVINEGDFPVFNGFYIANKAGITAANLLVGSLRNVIEDAYAGYVTDVFASLYSNRRRKLRQRKMIAVGIVTGSPKIDEIKDVDCPAGVEDGAVCQLIFSSFDVSYENESNEGQSLILKLLTMATQDSLLDPEIGLQSSIVSILPSTDIFVVGPAEMLRSPTQAPSKLIESTVGESGGSSVGLIMGIIIALLVAGAGVAFYFVRGGSPRSNQRKKAKQPKNVQSDEMDPEDLDMEAAPEMYGRFNKNSNFDDESSSESGSGSKDSHIQGESESRSVDDDAIASEKRNRFGFKKKKKKKGDDYDGALEDEDDGYGGDPAAEFANYAFEEPSDSAGTNPTSINDVFSSNIAGVPGTWGDHLQGGNAWGSAGDHGQQSVQVSVTGSEYSEESEENNSYSDDDSDGESGSSPDDENGDIDTMEDPSDEDSDDESETYYGDEATRGTVSNESSGEHGSVPTTMKRIDAMVEQGDWDGVREAAQGFASRIDDQTYISGATEEDQHQVETGDYLKEPEEPSTEDEDEELGDLDDVSSYNTEIHRRRGEVEALLRRVAPEELGNIEDMMNQFEGREEELINTLAAMESRAGAQRARQALHKSKDIPDEAIRFSAGGTEALTVVAAASTLTDFDGSDRQESLPTYEDDTYEDIPQISEEEDSYEEQEGSLISNDPDEEEGSFMDGEKDEEGEGSYVSGDGTYEDDGAASYVSGEGTYEEQGSYVSGEGSYEGEGGRSYVSGQEDASYEEEGQGSYVSGEEEGTYEEEGEGSYVSGEGTYEEEGQGSYASGQVSHEDEGEGSYISGEGTYEEEQDGSYVSGQEEGTYEEQDESQGSYASGEGSYEDEGEGSYVSGQEEGTYDEEQAGSYEGDQDASYITDDDEEQDGSSISGEEGSFYSEEQESFEDKSSRKSSGEASVDYGYE